MKWAAGAWALALVSAGYSVPRAAVAVVLTIGAGLALVGSWRTRANLWTR